MAVRLEAVQRPGRHRFAVRDSAPPSAHAELLHAEQRLSMKAKGGEADHPKWQSSQRQATTGRGVGAPLASRLAACQPTHAHLQRTQQGLIDAREAEVYD